MKAWAHHPNGTVSEIVPLPDDLVPGKDIFPGSFAADLTDVTGMDPQPAFAWTTTDGGKTFEAPAALGAPVVPAITFKADLYRRCTDAEAEAIETALMSVSVRERRLFESAQYLDHADPVFATMREAMEHMFGADRTAVLLAVS